MIIGLAFLGRFAFSYITNNGEVFKSAPILIALVFSFIIGHHIKQLSVTKKHYGFIGSSISLLISSLVLMINPVWDSIYYGGVIASILAIFFSIYDLIYYYNILATRKLPQFNRTGGDDRA